MRTDPNQDQDFVMSQEWNSSGRLTFYEKLENGKDVSNSFSGNERDHLYLNQNGQSFTDVSGLSGLDLATDGRSFVYLDYDHDGWLDVAVASANAPQLQILHNEIGQSVDESRHHVSLKLIGGNPSPDPSSKLSNRDGYGAKLTATLDNGLVIYREHSCGTGMAAQNSATLHLGIGTAQSIDELTIVWPSGISQTLKNIKPGPVHEFREQNE